MISANSWKLDYLKNISGSQARVEKLALGIDQHTQVKLYYKTPPNWLRMLLKRSMLSGKTTHPRAPSPLSRLEAISWLKVYQHQCDSTSFIHQCDQNFNVFQMYISAVNFPLVIRFSVRRQMMPVSACRVAFVFRDFPIGFI